LLDSVWRNVGDSDLALFVVDGSSVPPGPGDIFVARNLMKTGVPALLVMNKSDLICDDQVEERLRMFESLGDFVGSVAISALNGSNLDRLVNLVLDHLDEGPQFYPEGMQTDQPLEQFIGEIIREKIMLLTSDEIPYAVESQVDFLDEQEDIIRINATIYVERESQKPIIIGANGQMIKQIGTLARKELEVVLGKHVFLGLWVKVKENWRNNKEALYYFATMWNKERFQRAQLALRSIKEDFSLNQCVHTVAAFDVSFQAGLGVGVVALFNYQSVQLMECEIVVKEPYVPYVPTYLALGRCLTFWRFTRSCMRNLICCSLTATVRVILEVWHCHSGRAFFEKALNWGSKALAFW